MEENKNVFLVTGGSATGKSASLRNLPKPEGVAFFNCEAAKSLPFPDTFKKYNITDPTDVPDGIAAMEGKNDIHTVVVDSLTFMMSMYESVYVVNSANTMKAWGDYYQFFSNLMLQTIAKSTKNVILLAHTSNIYNEKDLVTETFVKLKGSIMNVGVESFFNSVVSTKRVSVDDLKPYSSELLNITEEDELLGFKYVFQTRLTKASINERIRSPMGLFTIDETFIDNDVVLVIKRLNEFYGKGG